MTSRYIVVGPGSADAAATVERDLATVLEQRGSLTRFDALAGTDATSVMTNPARALANVVDTVRTADSDFVLIGGLDELSARTFDTLAWNYSLAASTQSGVILTFDTEGVGTELLALDITIAVARAQQAHADIVAVALPHNIAQNIQVDVPVVSLPLDEAGVTTLLNTPQPQTVTPLTFQADLINRARADRKRIVLPEPEDDRVLQAAAEVLRRGIADIIFVGESDQVKRRSAELGLDLSAARTVSVHDPELREKYAEEFARLRAAKGVTVEQAREKLTDVSYFGTMMVHMSDADGMVSGAAHTTAHTIVPSFQIIKTAPGVSIVSSIFLMLMKDRVWAFGDCAVNPNPTPEQLADIAVSSAKTAEQFGIEPRVAMLSYSTGTSGSGPDVDAVAEATRLAREKAPELAIEGPIQFDAAVDIDVASKKLPGSPVAGQANVFIFPSLSSGNVGYKAVQRSAGAIAVGPVLQGLNKPVNDLSRGALVEDIVNTIALTAVQAQG